MGGLLVRLRMFALGLWRNVFKRLCFRSSFDAFILSARASDTLDTTSFHVCYCMLLYVTCFHDIDRNYSVHGGTDDEFI